MEHWGIVKMTVDTLTKQRNKRKDTTLVTLTSPVQLRRDVGSFLLGKEASKSPRTHEFYKFWLLPFMEYCASLGIEDVKDVKPDVLNIYFLGLKGRYSASSRAGCYTALKSFFASLVENEEIRKSPMSRIERPRVPEKVVQPYHGGDVGDLLTSFTGHSAFIAARMRAMILAFTDTGARRGEMCALTINDLAYVEELVEGHKEKHYYLTIVADNAKTRVERRVRLGTNASKAMNVYLAARGAQIGRKLKRKGRLVEPVELWLSEECTPLSPSGLYHSLQKECKRLKIDVPRVVHAFRNTAAIMWLENGGGESTLQTMGGWKTPSMMHHYTKAAERTNYERAHRTASPADNLKGV